MKPPGSPTQTQPTSVVTPHPLWLTITIIILWYACNIGVLLLNKYLLTHSGFDHPVFLTLCHMIACVVIGVVVSASGWIPAKPIKSRNQFLKIVVLAIIFCLTIALGNASLKFIPVSFNQAVGATTPFFTAILAYALQGQRETQWTYYSLAPIAAGVVIASGGEPSFHMIGFVCCLAATALRALKSVVQSILMTDPAEKLDPMSLLLYMSAASVLLLLPSALLFEPQAYTEALALMLRDKGFIYWLVSNSCLAYFVNLTNFLVTKYTSALTLQVLGNAKGVVAAMISVAVFANPVTLQGCMGYGVTVAGVFLYSETKRRSKQYSKAVPGSDGGKGGEAREPLLAEGKQQQGADLYFRGADRV